MTFDIQLFYLFNNLAGQSLFFDEAIVFFASYFPYGLIIIFLALLLLSAYESREKLEILLITAGAALVARFGITELIRFFYHRPRPFSVLPTHQLLTDGAWSFPSGHATFFFAMATAIYLYHKKWGIAFFVAAALIAVSRVAAGVHYPSDIIIGALIGIATAYAVYYLVRRFVAKQAPKTMIPTY